MENEINVTPSGVTHNKRIYRHRKKHIKTHRHTHLLCSPVECAGEERCGPWAKGGRQGLELGENKVPVASVEIYEEVNVEEGGGRKEEKGRRRRSIRRGVYPSYRG